MSFCVPASIFNRFYFMNPFFIGLWCLYLALFNISSSAEELKSPRISYLECPPRADAPQGKVDRYSFRSRILRNQRDIWVYTPHGFPQESKPYKLVLLFDGEAYTTLIPTPTILDNMIADGEIPPTVAVLVGSIDTDTRNIELPCCQPFNDSLITELLPWVRSHFHVSSNPADVVVAGSSYGGLAALFAGIKHPEIFGNVLSQSGSFWWKPEGASSPSWMLSLVNGTSCKPIRIYLEAGKLENIDYEGFPSILRVNRELQKLLKSQGYEVYYHEFNGGHDYFNWQYTLPEGLKTLLSNEMKCLLLLNAQYEFYNHVDFLHFSECKTPNFFS